MQDEPKKQKTPIELEKEYILETKRTVRKMQLIDFVHFYYEHLDELTFNQIVEEFKKQSYDKETTSI